MFLIILYPENFSPRVQADSSVGGKAACALIGADSCVGVAAAFAVGGHSDCSLNDFRQVLVGAGQVF